MEYLSITYKTTSVNLYTSIKISVYVISYHKTRQIREGVSQEGSKEMVKTMIHSKDMVKAMILKSDRFGFKSKLCLT